MSQSLSRDAIRGILDRQPVKVEVPEWGGHVFVRSMNGPDTFAYSLAVSALPDDAPMILARAILVAYTACDEDGNRLFDDSDGQWLYEEKSHVALKRIADEAEKLNRVASASVKELEKN